MGRMSYQGDNVLATFGFDQNPSSLVGRAIHCVRSIDSTWAVAEYARLTAMYGHPDVEPLYVSSETTFDMICDDLIENGWYLFDWGASESYKQWADVLDGNALYRVTVVSQFQPDCYATVQLFGSEVVSFVDNLSASGCWNIYKVVFV